jgi:hypothetical protein
MRRHSRAFFELICASPASSVKVGIPQIQQRSWRFRGGGRPKWAATREREFGGSRRSSPALASPRTLPNQ